MSPDDQIAHDQALEQIRQCFINKHRHLFLIIANLKYIPPEIGELTHLEHLRIGTSITSLPPEIGKLTNLRTFFAHRNQLTTLPPEIGDLTKLNRLDLDNNYLRKLPPELGKLKNLRRLAIYSNRLTTLPREIATLGALKHIFLSGNPLHDPPITVAKQGIEAIRRYFADKEESGTELLWQSKLLLVGQGRVGKTELRHRLMKRPHGHANSTEGVEIETLSLTHPDLEAVTMELRCWDFGGQDIYHATHQFFLTGRSLFVFCFEAGKDWEAGKPYYWLDKISAVAPEAPVVIVATKTDERPTPSLPWDDLKKRYPQIIGNGCFSVTTKTKDRKDKLGDGIDELVNCLRSVASDREKLPLMGEELPKSWISGMNAITEHPNHYYLRKGDFNQLLGQASVPQESQHTVALMLRDLGEILYYSDEADSILHDHVIIKPTWVTHAAACILDSKDVEENEGILTQKEMSNAWADYPPEMHPVLLDLLEKYDLTYKIPDDPQDRSLVVERLPKNPVDVPEIWDQFKPASHSPNRQMRMTFQLGSMQAGIPTWFIARKHYHTLRRHWLYGVYFADNRNSPRHIALVRASTDPRTPSVDITVRGPFPQTFFAVMTESLDASIRDRYPKLIERRTIPCSCLDQISGENRCGHTWDMWSLEDMFEAAVQTVRCQQKPFREVTIRQLLSGYADPLTSIQKDLHHMEQRIIDKVQNLSDRVEDLAEQERENFRYLFNDLQQREESHCPSYFVIWKAEKGKPFHVPMRLALVCQHPGVEHVACHAENSYKIDALNEQLRSAAPLLKRMATFLKYAKLAGLPLLKEWEKEIAESVGDVQDGINEMLEDFERIATNGGTPELLEGEIDDSRQTLQEKRLAGAALREFRVLLDKLDPTHKWHGLEKKRSKRSGIYLWVCHEHAADSDYSW